MALNPKTLGKMDTECTTTDGSNTDGSGSQKNSVATSASANQNGDQPGCGDSVMPEQEAPERRRTAPTDARSFSSSPLPGQRPNEELPRKNFQIPRKIRERKGLYQFLPPDSREFEDLVKTISSFYLDSASRGTFTYCKARLIHNELLEKEFIEKRREMKQEGRSELELAESFCFLFPDKSKLQWICEKGLTVGHSKITTLGNPSLGVYLSKHSDLLQINPFEAGSFGDIIVFKVMRGRIKHIHENMPKNAIEPTPKFDCHLSKRANRVTSLLSYRAFEFTQQYFFEFAFEEIKARPRHVCPYAVVSFQYKSKEGATTPLTAHRFNTISPEGSRGKSCYTVWSGPLVNKGEELFPICLRSSLQPYLPFKLSDKLEMNQGMQLEQVKRKIPSVLFSWDTYSASREVMKFGLSCSLFEVVDGKGKPSRGNLAALVNKLERDRMVLVKSLFDRGFLFILTSTQMQDSKERWGRVERNLHALFIFQESRIVAKYSSRLNEPEQLSAVQPAILSSTEPFIPALHYSLFKLRPNPGKDLSLGVERQATDYLTRIESGTVRTFVLPDYKSNVDDRTNLLPVPRPKFNMDAVLRTYVHNFNNYILPLTKAKDIIDRIRNPVPVPVPTPIPVEYSPVSDWGGSDKGSDRAERPSEKLLPERPPPDKQTDKRRTGLAHSNGGQVQNKANTDLEPPAQKLQVAQSEYDEEKMKKLLKLIQLHKKTRVKDPGKEDDDWSWDANSLKRKSEGDDKGAMNKRQRKDSLSNGEPSQGSQTCEFGDEGSQNDNLISVMERMGYDTDLRAHGTQESAVSETQNLLKILLATLNKAVAQGSVSNDGEPLAGSEKTDPVIPSLDQKKQTELTSQTNYTEEDMDCSPGSPCSAGSPTEQAHTSNDSNRVLSNTQDKVQLSEPGQESMPELKPEIKPELKPELKPKLKLEPKPEEAVPEAESHQEPKGSAVVEVKNTVPPPMLPIAEEVPSRPSISLDTILNQEVRSLTSDIKSLMQSHNIFYTSKLSPRLPLQHCWLPNSCFSDFVVPYITPVPIQSHVNALCEKMDNLIQALPDPSKDTSLPPPVSTSNPTTPASTTTQTSKTKEISSDKSSTFTNNKPCKVKDMSSSKTKTEVPAGEERVELYSPTHATPDSPEVYHKGQAPASGSGSGLLAGSLIGQLKPEVFTSLVEIFKDVTKNTVKFYIYSGDEAEESAVCKEIKDYLISLGNSECSPQAFLENSGSLDKLLIIIQNEHIAAHVHKIPALVSLKKLPSVSFAGVDSLDDVKNHTYNELFVSGGFMVSDEFVLNPDCITQDRLQGLLKFLEEQSTPEHPWQWKVHCKSQKKLKEMGRLNANAMGLLNLLTIYQKKHLVEFLPYHECDTQSRQAPDLECLIKLQAQHTQQRHLIFLTERPFEMFLQYSRNGIVIASIDDVMSSFHSLIGSINQNELPTPPSTVVNDECTEEDMSIDSEDDGEPPAISEPAEQSQESEKLLQPPLPDKEEFRPPLPEQQTTPESTSTLNDYSVLKTVISQFKAANQLSSSDYGSLSPGGFPVNPHQSFLCPSAPWSSYTGSSSYTASPAYPSSPCSSTQDTEYRPTVTTFATAPTTPALATAEPLANLVSLPLEVKPPPPPHLMMLGHTYGSETTGSEAAGTSPLPTSLPFSDNGDRAQLAYTAGIASDVTGTPGDRTLSGPGEGAWGTASSQSVVTSHSVETRGENVGSSTPSSQGDRTPMNCTEKPGSAVGVPTADTRGGSKARPRMPPPHVLCGAGYGGFGGLPEHGQMDRGPVRGAMSSGSVGGFRGRGPVGHWPRPVRGRGTGGPPCYWGSQGGRGGGQNYYSDFSYSQNYAPE